MRSCGGREFTGASEQKDRGMADGATPDVHQRPLAAPGWGEQGDFNKGFRENDSLALFKQTK